jgi:hypothetical protein
VRSAGGPARPGPASSQRPQSLARLEALRDGMSAARNAYWTNQAVQRLAVAGWIARAEAPHDEAVTLLKSLGWVVYTAECSESASRLVDCAFNSRPGLYTRYAAMSRSRRLEQLVQRVVEVVRQLVRQGALAPALELNLCCPRDVLLEGCIEPPRQCFVPDR